MTQALRPLVAGNWKMNGLRAALAEIATVRDGIAAIAADVALCPPATLIAAAAQTCSASALVIGAQNCHAEAFGPHTGELSAEMLTDAGARLIIVGHSERRQEFAETDAIVCAKARAVVRAGATAIVCVGETQEQRNAGETLSLIARQIRGSIPSRIPAERLIVAYEPVWAIGTGVTPTGADIEEVHAFIRAELDDWLSGEGASVRILYGGSVKPENAAQLLTLARVNGALVGGASLMARDFLAIAHCYG
jgi:triosephosphate isomerase